MSFLDILEGKLQSLIEGNLDRLLDKQTMSAVFQAISELIDSFIREVENGEKIAPDLFIIKVPQEPFDYWTTHKDLLEDITTKIYQAGLESGYQFKLYPRLIFELANDMKTSEIKINGTITQTPSPIDHTEIFHSPQLSLDSTQLPQNAFIVVDGKITYPLTKTIVNIGRLSTSEIRLDDIHVSRKHLQLRAVEGNYLLFDLDSVGGTFVNGQKCQTVKLTPGDVIKVGNTTMIYFQDKDNQINKTTKFRPNGIEI